MPEVRRRSRRSDEVSQRALYPSCACCTHVNLPTLLTWYLLRAVLLRTTIHTSPFGCNLLQSTDRPQSPCGGPSSSSHKQPLSVPTHLLHHVTLLSACHSPLALTAGAAAASRLARPSSRVRRAQCKASTCSPEGRRRRRRRAKRGGRRRRGTKRGGRGGCRRPKRRGRATRCRCAEATKGGGGDTRAEGRRGGRLPKRRGGVGGGRAEGHGGAARRAEGGSGGRRRTARRAKRGRRRSRPSAEAAGCAARRGARSTEAARRGPATAKCGGGCRAGAEGGS